MTCFMCKGSMQESTTTHVVDLGQCIIIIKNVPCFKCSQCGETSFTGTVAAQIEKIVDTLSAAVTEIAVVNYPDRVA